MSEHRDEKNDDVREAGDAQIARRRLLQAIAATTAFVALPTAWNKPLVKLGVLPAHADMSPVGGTSSSSSGGTSSSSGGTSSGGTSSGEPGKPVTVAIDNETFDHKVGQTECPQPVGTLTLTNGGSDELTYEITTESGAQSPLNVDPTSGTLPAGGNATIDVKFNCIAPSPVDEDLTITIKKGDTVVQEEKINVKGNVA